MLQVRDSHSGLDVLIESGLRLVRSIKPVQRFFHVFTLFVPFSGIGSGIEFAVCGCGSLDYVRSEASSVLFLLRIQLVLLWFLNDF